MKTRCLPNIPVGSCCCRVELNCALFRSRCLLVYLEPRCCQFQPDAALRSSDKAFAKPRHDGGYTWLGGQRPVCVCVCVWLGSYLCGSKCNFGHPSVLVRVRINPFPWLVTPPWLITLPLDVFLPKSGVYELGRCFINHRRESVRAAMMTGCGRWKRRVSGIHSARRESPGCHGGRRSRCTCE